MATESETVEVGDQQVRVIETEDGFEVEPLDPVSTKNQAMELYASAHPAITGHRECDSEYDYYVDYEPGTTPGTNAIGNLRTDAEEELYEHGYEIDVEMVEPRSGSDTVLLLGLTLVETED